MYQERNLKIKKDFWNGMKQFEIMSYGLVIQFHPSIDNELKDYIFNIVMKLKDPYQDGLYEAGEFSSLRYFDEGYTSYSECNRAFSKLEKFLNTNIDFWKGKILYVDIQHIDKKTDERDSYKTCIGWGYDMSWHIPYVA
jgi:hypothetical protein